MSPGNSSLGIAGIGQDLFALGNMLMLCLYVLAIPLLRDISAPKKANHSEAHHLCIGWALMVWHSIVWSYPSVPGGQNPKDLSGAVSDPAMFAKTIHINEQED